MAGIYIPGMEMPTSCGDCKAFVCYRQWAGDVGDCFCGITKSDVKVGVRNADCPLISVPPHGDLIDRDALPWENQGLMLTDPDEWGLKAWDIEHAPTIIPASEENK